MTGRGVASHEYSYSSDEAMKTVTAALTAILVEQLSRTNGADKVEYRPYLQVSPTHDPEELGFHFGLIDTDSDEVTNWLARLLPKAG